MPHDHFLEEQPQDFDDYANHLLEQGLQQSPSLVHGGICALQVADVKQEAEHYLELLEEALDIDFQGGLAEASLQLIAATELALANDEYEFHLFLPDDETELSLRVQALADWCAGFVAAYALTAAEGRGLAEEVGEVLRDVAAISEAGFDDETDEEEAESNYFEIGEYLRFAVLNVYLDALEQVNTAP